MREPFSLHVADVQKRITAFVIDDIVVSIFFFIIFYDQIKTKFLGISVIDVQVLENFNTFVAENMIVIFAIKVLYHTVLVWQSGMTLGKYIVKIKVVDLQSGNIPSFGRSLIRALLRIPSELFLYTGFALAFFTPLRQTFHDKLSNCVVIDA
ncbi:MAG: RDD family protein [Campylobacterales bacterium]|nr:RDD family protein [Campylobacterales bacterium]